MIRRQSLNSIYLYLSEKAAADYIKLSRRRERERERESPNQRRRRILRASPACSRFHLFLLFHAEKCNTAYRVQPRSQDIHFE